VSGRRRPCAWPLLAALGCVAFGPVALASADERIAAFDSTITVQPDGSLDVHESIRVIAAGRDIRRGIYREFPTSYPAEAGRTVTVGFGFDSAMRDGAPEPWRVEPVGNGVRIWLGSANVLLPKGEHVYELQYHTDRQMGFFADHDELYWNVNGLGWNFSADEVSARVVLPAGVPPGQVRLEAYVGASGERGTDFRAALESGMPVFRTTRAMAPHEGLTIVVSWPKGFITAAEARRPPATVASPGYDFASNGQRPATLYGSPAEAILKRELPHDGRPAWFALAGLALLLVYYYRVWSRVGRDPPGRVIIPEYEMKQGLSAAAMRYLMQMGYDDKCFAAAVMSLAVKGHLRIVQDAGVLGLGKKFTLVREEPKAARPSSADESALLAQIFSAADSVELVQKNYATVRGARTQHRSAIERSYQAGYFRINGAWHFLGALLSLLVVGVTVLQPGASEPWPRWFLTTPGGWASIAALLGCFVANIVFGRLLKAPSVAGQALLDHIRGFKMYLEVAEGEQLKRAGSQPPRMTPELYESYLPAALALGVEQKWGEKFARVLAIDAPSYHPSWYSGSGWNAANVAGFTANLGSSLSSSISSASSPPGSHSGAGGGGSSGGGGGGGGGGGW
jgi:hypothetical protein